MEEEKKPMTAEEAEAQKKDIVDHMLELQSKIVAPHTKVSREVTEADLDRVLKDTEILYELCYVPTGLYEGAIAMHHAQIDDQDPLNFFVTVEKELIINPVITRHVNYFTDSKEACMTFPNNPEIIVQRWHKIEVTHKTVTVDPDDEKKFKLSNEMVSAYSGRKSFVVQHEIYHGMAKYIYPIE